MAGIAGWARVDRTCKVVMNEGEFEGFLGGLVGVGERQGLLIGLFRNRQESYKWQGGEARAEMVAPQLSLPRAPIFLFFQVLAAAVLSVDSGQARQGRREPDWQKMLMAIEPRRIGGERRTAHVPVLLREVLQWLDVKEGNVVLDGTVGAGGHSRELLKQIGPSGRLIGMDRDPGMLRRAEELLAGGQVCLRQGSYSEAEKVLRELGIEKVDRVLLDLGLSSDQLASAERGFGFGMSGILDMRFDMSAGEGAWEILAKRSEGELAQIFREYGEERFSEQIAREIVERRKREPIQTARELSELVAGVVRRGPAQVHPATRVFQALRIEANDELGHLERMLNEVLPRILASGGMVGVITFHSLEDRMVKQAFRNEDVWENLTRKPITASAMEERQNPRSRSAKLRIARRK